MNEKNKVQKLLLIDDDEFLLDIYSIKFREEGIETTTAESGSEALELLKEQEFDLILLDIIMPKMDGLEVLKKIRDQNLANSTCLVVLSNQGRPEDIEKAEEFDIDGYIIKASTVPSEVLERIEEIYQKTS